jgi:hypothetical protein
MTVKLRAPPDITPDDVKALEIVAKHVLELLRGRGGVQSSFKVEVGYTYAPVVYMSGRDLMSRTIDQLFRAFEELPSRRTPDERGVEHEIGDVTVEICSGMVNIGGRDYMEFRLGVHVPRSHSSVLHIYADLTTFAGDEITVDMLVTRVGSGNTTRYRVAYTTSTSGGVKTGVAEVSPSTTLESLIQMCLRGVKEREPVCCREE